MRRDRRYRALPINMNCKRRAVTIITGTQKWTACRTPEHRLQAVGTGDGGRAGLAGRGSAPGGGSCAGVLRTTAVALGERLAGGQSRRRVCKMVRCR